LPQFFTIKSIVPVVSILNEFMTADNTVLPAVQGYVLS